MGTREVLVWGEWRRAPSGWAILLTGDHVWLSLGGPDFVARSSRATDGARALDRPIGITMLVSSSVIPPKAPSKAICLLSVLLVWIIIESVGSFIPDLAPSIGYRLY